MSDVIVTNLPKKFSSVRNIFDKYTSVFGVHIFATEKTPLYKVRWAANILSEYLDNDKDGEVDNPLVLKSMLDVPMRWREEDEPSEEEKEKWKTVKLQSAIFMSFDENDQNDMRSELSKLNDIGDNDYIEQIERNIHGGGQDLMATETGNDLKNESGEDIFDASLEEILHLITGNGYANAYPNIFGENKDSEIAKLMDKARGGYYEEVPEKYPDDAWYTYYDKSCDYRCQITEYTYWGILTQLKADWKIRKRTDLVNEWKILKNNGSLMTLKERDSELHELLTNNKYIIPKNLPQGEYKIRDDWYSKSYIETQYEKAYNLIYSTWKKKLDKNILIEGRNILLDLYQRVNKDFKGSIVIEYDIDTVYYKGTATSYGYTPYVAPTPAPTPTPTPQPIINTKRELFNFTKSDIYTDIAYSYRVDNINTFSSEIVNYYEKAMNINSNNWRTLQYYGIYHAQTNNKEGAEEYMQKLKNAVTENGVIDSKWDKVIEDFQNNINKIKTDNRYLLYEEKSNDQIINDINTKKMNFDYIIIGGGPAGIMSANRIAELKPESKILLIEKGKEKYADYKEKGYNKLNNWLRAAYDVNFTTSFPSDKLDLSNNTVGIAMGQGLGGGTNHFGLQYIDQIKMLSKSSPSEFATGEWEKILSCVNKVTKTKSYKYDNSFPLVLRNLNNVLLDNSNNGFDYGVYNNKIYSRDLKTRFSLASILEDKSNVYVMYDITVDRIDGDYMGRGGEYMDDDIDTDYKSGLGTVQKGDVKKIMFFNKTNDIAEQPYIDVSEKTQVILCAGAIFTSCILQRSGIGLKNTLKKSGTYSKVGLKLRLPVGETLYDHAGVNLTYINTDVVDNLGQVDATLIGHIQTRERKNKWQTYYSLIPDQSANKLLPIMSVTFAEAGQIKNEGYVRIKSTLNEPPLVKPCFYECPESIANCIEAFKINNRILEQSNFRCSVPSLLENLTDTSDGDLEIEKFFKKNLFSIYHYHGTCPIDKVVDINQKIFGINNCYIGDISVLRDPYAGSTSVASLCTGYRVANYLCLYKERKRSMEEVIGLSKYLGVKAVRNLYTKLNESDFKKKYTRGLTYSYVIRKYHYCNIHYEKEENKLLFSENEEGFTLKGDNASEIFDGFIEMIKLKKPLEYIEESTFFLKIISDIEHSPEHKFMYVDELQSDRVSVMGGVNGEKELFCKVSADISNNYLIVNSNGVPNYKPSVGDNIEIKGSWKDELSSSKDRNPNIIGESNWQFKIPLIDVTINPVNSDMDDLNNVSETSLSAIGVTLNGVPLFNPWHNNEDEYTSESRDATTFATFDSCCGHPAPPEPGESGEGPYHYHKYPTCVAGNMGISNDRSLLKEHDIADVLDDRLTLKGKKGHSPLLGYMLDGYPIYGPLGTTSNILDNNTEIKILKSSYKFDEMKRSYNYIKGEGDLDKCNAIYSATPEYPKGCYHYVLSITPDETGKCYRTTQKMYLYPDGIKKPMITTSYPHTTIYYRGNPNKAMRNKTKKPERKKDNDNMVININESLMPEPVRYKKENNNLMVFLKPNKEYGIYCKTNKNLKIVNGILNVNLTSINGDCDIYIWEKITANSNKFSRTYLTEKNCDSKHVSLINKKRNTRGPIRSYAGVRWMSKKDHEKLPHLIRSVLGRAVWANTTLYYITTSDYDTWAENELFLIKHAFSQYERVTKLKFIETNSWDKADIEIKRKNQHPTNKNIVGSSYGPSYYGAEVIIYAGSYKSNNNSDDYPKGGYVGGWDYATFIHEIGHAVGLMHPHEKVEGSIAMEGIEFDWTNNTFSKNNRANAFPFTVMSYNDVTSRYTPGWTLNYGYMSTLGPVDIAALQSVYGKNEDYNGNNTIYKLPSTSGKEIAWESIYDTGGIDTISSENATNNTVINLNDSDVTKNDGSGLEISNQKNVWGGSTVASGVKIENAIGGKFNDNIYENKLSNVIDGKAGIDSVYTLGKNTDYLLYQDPIQDNEKWTLINIKNNNEENTLLNIEFVVYSNGITQNLNTLETTQVFPETARGIKISLKK